MPKRNLIHKCNLGKTIPKPNLILKNQTCKQPQGEKGDNFSWGKNVRHSMRGVTFGPFLGLVG